MPKRKSSEPISWIEVLVRGMSSQDLISVVEEHPALWDSNHPDYNDNFAKDKSWFEVCAKLDDGFESRHTMEKNLIRKAVHRRWRNLRDCYNRELRRLRSLKTDLLADRKRPYLYYEQMRFLEGTLANGASQSDGEVEVKEDSEEPTFRQRDTPRRIMTSTTSVAKREEEENAFIKCITERFTKQSTTLLETLPTRDSDTLFFMSLIDDFKKVPDHMKMLVKSQIMNVILQNQVHPQDL